MATNVPTNTLTRDIVNFAEPTGNIYKTVAIIAKRANQIAVDEKKEISEALSVFRNERDTMEEITTNAEQTEVSKKFERRSKPALVAIAEFEQGELSYRDAIVEEDPQEVKERNRYEELGD